MLQNLTQPAVGRKKICRIQMKYTKELLLEIMKEGNAVLLGEYPKYNQRMRVDFQCSCGNLYNKRFEMLNLYRLPYCKECSNREQKLKGEKTCMEKYGCKNAAQDPKVKEKIQASYLERFGDHPKRTKEVHDKWVATCKEKYGGHPNQNPEVQAKSEKSSFKFKDYKLPSGTIIKYQGYENLAIDELLKLYKEEDIIIGRDKVPVIQYYIDSTKHVYFPDIFIPHENKIIEVKSDWSIQYKRANVEEKAAATIGEGYLYEIWVYNEKKQRVKTIVYE